jgi:hypothetical protein
MAATSSTNHHSLSKALGSAAVLGVVVALLSGCAIVDEQQGFLPDAIRAATAQAQGRGYPDLSKLPEVPTTLPTATAWRQQQSELARDSRTLAANPKSRTVPEGGVDDRWARQAAATLDRDPRAAPPQDGEDPAAWAEAERKRLDGMIARLPPY